MRYLFLFILLFPITIFAQAPANDEPCGATILTVKDSSQGCSFLNYINLDNATANDTAAAGIINGCPVGQTNRADLWYKFKMPASGQVHLEGFYLSSPITNSINDMGIHVYKSNVCNDSFQYITCNDDAGEAFMPLLNITNGIAGDWYYIRAYQFDGGADSAFNLCIHNLVSGASNNDSSYVGIGTMNPVENLDVIGDIKVDTLKLNVLKFLYNPAPGKVLTAGNGGVASWQTPTVQTNYWTQTGSDISNNNTGNVGINTTTPNAYGHGGNNKILEIKNTNTSVNSQSQVILSTGAADGSMGGITWAQHNIVTQPMAGFIGCVLDPFNTGSKLAFYTRTLGATPTLTERMVIDGNGNMGIGVSNPTYKIHIGNDVNGLRVEGPATAGGTAMSIGGNGDVVVDKPGIVGGRLTIKENGNIGIGTNNPTQTLSVIGNTNINGNANITGNMGIGGQPLLGAGLNLQSSGLSVLEITSTGSFGSGRIQFRSDLGLANEWRPAYFQSRDDGGFFGGLEFFTNGFGVANKFGSVLGMVIRNGTVFTPTGTVSTWSDRRLKKNIQPFTDGLNIINKITPVTYNYNEKCMFQTDKQQVGIIAQELEAVAPYMIEKSNTKDIENLLSVNNQAYIFLLINAVKEQQAQIELQNKKIEDLSNKLNNAGIK